MPANSILIPFISKDPNDTNPKLKHLASSIERALGSWDNVEQWADYISFVGKLHKAIKGYRGPPNIQLPYSDKISHRLSQCLEPDHPHGVHQKTLELYKTIFDLLVPDHLDPSIWLPGLLPLMAYASMNVKPMLIALLDKYIVPLPSLATILRPLLLAVLPGIDDESSESFGDVLKLIENIQIKVADDSHFWQCMFLSVISSDDRRLGALAWCSRRLPSFSVALNNVNYPQSISNAYQAISYEAQLAITPESGLLIRAFCKGLMDEHQLVQRGFLELLVKHLQLQSPVLQVIASKSDLQLLVINASSVVLRRDMSLNRRLWNWLLGPEPPVNEVGTGHLSRSQYFEKYALISLTDGLLNMINKESQDPAEKSRAYRICLSILDRWEIGSAVVPRVFLPIIKSVRNFHAKSEADYEELLRSASSFFDGIEAVTIFEKCLSLVTEDQDLDLLLYILTMFNVREEDMLVNHLPLLLLALLMQPEKDNEDIWFSVAHSIVRLIPERAFNFVPEEPTIKGPEILSKIKEFYEKSSSNEDIPLPFDVGTLTRLLLDQASILAIDTSNTLSGGRYLHLLSDILAKIPDGQKWENAQILDILMSNNEISDYSMSDARVSLFNVINTGISEDARDQFVFNIIPALFKFLSDPSGRFQVETVKSIWSLQESLGDRRVQSALATIMVDPMVSTAQKTKAFGALWYHLVTRTNCEIILDRCLFLYLDLDHSTSQPSPSWLKRDLQNLFNMITTPLIQSDDYDQTVYYAGLLYRILNRDEDSVEYLKKNANEVTEKILDVYISADSNCNNEELQRLLDLLFPVLSLDEINQSYERLVSIYNETVVPPLRECLRHISARQDASFDFMKSIDYSLKGLTLACNDSAADKSIVLPWLKLLTESMGYFSGDLSAVTISISAVLCECTELKFDALKKFASESVCESTNFAVIPTLLGGLEEVLGMASRYVFGNSLRDRPSQSISSVNSNPDDSGFLGNVISGVFSVESPTAMNSAAETIPDLLKCLQMVTNLSFKIWAWVDGRNSNAELVGNESVIFILSKVKSRARYLLTQLYKLNPAQLLECLVLLDDDDMPVFKLIHILDGSHPKDTAPFLLEQITSRKLDNRETHGSSAKVSGIFSSSTNGANTMNAFKDISTPRTITEFSLFRAVEFMCKYLDSLENDAIEEVYSECMSFFKEIQTDLIQYRPVLPGVLTMLSIVTVKVDLTKFGTQRRTRKEISEIFMKLLNHMLTRGSNKSIREDSSPKEENEKVNMDVAKPLPSTSQETLVKTLEKSILPNLRVLLNEDSEKVQTVLGIIFQNLVTPALRNKSFPHGVASYVPGLILIIIRRFPQSAKVWRPLLGEAIFDSHFMRISYDDVLRWMPVINKWSMTDKDRLLDYISRVSSYGTNTNLFNWSDQQNITQANVNRLSLLFLCSKFTDVDCQKSTGTTATWTDVVNYNELVRQLEKLVDTENLSRFGPDVFAFLRAIFLSVDPARLASITTFTYTEMRRVLSDYAAEKNIQLSTVVACCKLLDLMLVLNLEDFQMVEWLFIQDNLDAILKKDNDATSSLLGAIAKQGTQYKVQPIEEDDLSTTEPLLTGIRVDDAKFDDLVPFIHRASISTYEGTYHMDKPNIRTCLVDLLEDLITR